MSNYSEFDKKGYTVTATDFVITHNGYTLSLVSVEHRMDDCAELYVEIKDENGAPVKAAEGYISNFDFAPNFADVQNKNDVINLVNYTRKTGSVVAEINQAMVDALKSFTKSNPSNDGFFKTLLGQTQQRGGEIIMYSVSEIFTATEIEINDEAWLIDIARRVNEILEMPCNADKKDSHSAKIIAKDRAHSWANLEKLGQTVNNDHFFL